MAQPSSSTGIGWLSAEMKYILQGEVGIGKIASIHKAVDVDSNKVLAVKVFYKLPSEVEESKRRLVIRNEAIILNAVRNGVSAVIRDSCENLLPLPPRIFFLQSSLRMSC
jgi:hypothetical protein